MPIELLNDLHDHSRFDCGKPTLNDFLQAHALNHAKKGFSKSFVEHEDSSNVIRGYYAYAPNSVTCVSFPVSVPRLNIPVILLGQFAVDLSFQESGIGKRLLRHFFKGVVKFADEYPCFAVSLDAIDGRAKEWYQQFGFKELLDNPLHLYLRIKTIRKLDWL